VKRRFRRDKRIKEPIIMMAHTPIATELTSTPASMDDDDDLLYAMRRMLQNMECGFPGRSIISAHSRESGNPVID
jgi:hypothetical protein